MKNEKKLTKIGYVNKKILIVDPVYTRLLLEKTCLSRKEYNIITASKGSEGIKKAKEEKPNLILFPTNLFDMDGVELCKIIRNDEQIKNTSLILVVAKDDDSKINQIMSSGCNDFITFPLNRIILDQKLSIFLNIATRKELRIMVQLRIVTNSLKGFHLGTSINLSKSGMLLETPISMNIGEEIFLKFFLPKNPKQIETKSIVVREEVFKNIKKYGLKFVDLDLEYEKMIENFTLSE